MFCGSIEIEVSLFSIKINVLLLKLHLDNYLPFSWSSFNLCNPPFCHKSMTTLLTYYPFFPYIFMWYPVHFKKSLLSNNSQNISWVIKQDKEGFVTRDLFYKLLFGLRHVPKLATGLYGPFRYLFHKFQIMTHNGVFTS